MDFGFILIVAAYLGALQLATRANVGALLCAVVAVGLPYVVTIITQWILIKAHSGALLADLFPVSGIVSFIVQFIVAFIVFKKIQNDDSIASMIGWGIGGFIGIVILIPLIIQKIIQV